MIGDGLSQYSITNHSQNNRDQDNKPGYGKEYFLCAKVGQ
jgi:hypothetical protein